MFEKGRLLGNDISVGEDSERGTEQRASSTAIRVSSGLEPWAHHPTFESIQFIHWRVISRNIAKICFASI